MLTHDPSVAASTASSGTDIDWNIPPKSMLGPTSTASKVRSRRKNNKPGVDPTTDASTAKKWKDDHPAADEEPICPDSQPSEVDGSTPVYDLAFNFSDYNIQIRTKNRLFRIHQFKLNEFDRLRPKLEEAPRDDKGRMSIKLQDDADDFHNLLVVLYSSLYNFHLFSSAILKSALKLATKYTHPSLQKFILKELEKHTLEPIDRFIISRDCGLTEWMTKAIDDLCWREEAITVAEAQILGPEKFVEVATRREGIKFERGSRVGLDRGQPPQASESIPEPTVPSRPKSQDLGGILTASNDLLATTSRKIKPISKDDSGSVAPSLNTALNQPSDNASGGSPNSQLMKFEPAKFGGGKPLLFSFNPNPVQFKAPPPSLFQPRADERDLAP